MNDQLAKNDTFPTYHPYTTKTFSVKTPWYTGEAQVLTYSIEELLGTKLRALYQRKKAETCMISGMPWSISARVKYRRYH